MLTVVLALCIRSPFGPSHHRRHREDVHRVMINCQQSRQSRLRDPRALTEEANTRSGCSEPDRFNTAESQCPRRDVRSAKEASGVAGAVVPLGEGLALVVHSRAEGLAFVREILLRQIPSHAWPNFEFRDSRGRSRTSNPTVEYVSSRTCHNNSEDMETTGAELTATLVESSASTGRLTVESATSCTRNGRA
jgi:hypothetical protein